MITVSVKEASDKLPDLVENKIARREPVLISGKNRNAVLMAESDWQAMNETLQLIVRARNTRRNSKWLV